MNQYLLDTNVCISLLKGQHGIREKVLEVGFDNCYVSEITIAELHYGAFKSQKEKHHDDVKFIIQHFIILPITDSLSTFGQMRYHLEAVGKRIDDFDLLIGCTAIDHNLTIVTHNTKHLGRIPGIHIVDWQAE